MNFFLTLFALATIRDCGTDPVFSIVSQSFVPESPKAGDNVSWTIQYKVPDGVEIPSGVNINSGMINGFIPITPTETDLCSVVHCPITPGEYTLTNWQTWPAGLESTKVSLISEWVNENYGELLCSSVTINGGQAKTLRGKHV